MDIHMYLYSLRCSILVHNLSMQQKQEVDRPLFFFRLWSPGRMRPRRLPGSCLLTRDLHGNKHSAACYTSTVSNTPPYSVYRDECGFFVMGSNPQSKRIQTLGEIKGRIGAALYLVYFDPPSILVRYPFCMWILIDDANLLWKYHIWTTRHGGCRSGARCIPYGWTDAGEANHREDGRWSGSWKHRYWFFHEPEFAFHGIGLKSLTDWNTAYVMCGMFFYLTGWIKSAPTYNYPCWIVVALIFTVQRCLICVIVIGSRNLCFILRFVGQHWKLSMILNVADMRR